MTKAEIVVAPRDKWEWLKLQLLNINLTNLTLIFAVMALGISINHTLDSQRRENENAQLALTSLRAGLPAAQEAVEWIKNSSVLIGHFKNISIYAEQLQTAQNTIQQLQNELLDIGLTRDTQWQLATGNVPVAWTSSGVSLTLDRNGTWLLWAQVSMSNTGTATMLCGCMVADGIDPNPLTSDTCPSYSRQTCSTMPTGTAGANNHFYTTVGPIAQNTCQRTGVSTSPTVTAWFVANPPGATGGAGQARVFAQYLSACP